MGSENSRIDALSTEGVPAIEGPLDDRARGFYARWGFQDLPFDPRRAMIVRTIDLERSGLDW